MKDFLNRISKNTRELQKWSNRTGTAVYRIYDRDIPQFPFVVDHLCGWVVIASLARDEQLVVELSNSAPHIAEILSVPESRIVFRQRERQRGLSQYEKSDRPPLVDVIRENDLRFEINLTQYLDVGLFIDHRKTRAVLKEFVRGMSCLNLFCYTGSVSVAMAVGGAALVDSIDMSRTYLEWARRNFKLNHLQDRDQNPHYGFIQQDVLSWLRQQVQLPGGTAKKYDFIFVDPPSFSNSKRMDGTFDVQRDHVWLLESVAQLLAPEGVLVFSNNRAGFKIDSSVLSGFVHKHTTELSHPRDFRARPAHHSFVLSRSMDAANSYIKSMSRLGPDF